MTDMLTHFPSHVTLELTAALKQLDAFAATLR